MKFKNYGRALREMQDRARIKSPNLIKTLNSTFEREKKVTKKIQKIYGTNKKAPEVIEPVIFDNTEFLDNPIIEEIVIPPPFTTRINIFFDDSGSMNRTLLPLEQMVSEGTLKSIILPYYNNDSAAYDANVTIQKFSLVPGLSTTGGHPDGVPIAPYENSIVLGGTTMREISSSRNVINIMFQDETGFDTLRNFTGLSAGIDSALGQPGVAQGIVGHKKGSVDFLTGGLIKNDKHRAFFFQVDSGVPTDPQIVAYRTLMVDLSGLLQNTPFRNQTTFTLDTPGGSSPATYATLIGRALSVASEDIN